MSDGNQLAFSLIYKVIDGASAKIREITSLMHEPRQAAEELGDASEKSSDRQVSAWAKAKQALDDLTEGMSRPVEHAVELGRAAGEAAERFSKSFAGIGALAAEGFSAKDVADQEEFFRRLRVNSDLAKSAIEELGEKIADASQKYGVNKANLLNALEAYRDQGGNPEDFGRNAGNVAAAQALGMNPYASGVQLASLARLGITDPKQVLSVLSAMNAQLGGIPERMNAAAEASDRLVATMQSLHIAGAQGALSLNAVYAVAARSMGGNARAARTATDNWLQQLADRGYQNQLAQGLGQRVTDANGFVMDPRVIMQMMAAKYAQAMSLPQNQQAVSLQRLDALFGDDAARMFRAVGGQIKTSGHSDILQQALGAQGDPSAYLKRAQDASDGLTGGLNRLRAAMEKASEAVLVGPIDTLAEVLNSFNGTIAKVVISLAALVTVGQAMKWVGGAVEGFSLLWGVMGTGISIIGGVLSGLVVGLANVALAFVPVIAETIAWTVALLANPATWIVLGVVVAVAALTAGVLYLYKHWNDAWGAMPGPVKAIGAVLDNLWTGAKRLSGEFFDWAESKWDKLVAKFHAGWSWLSGLWGGGDEKEEKPGEGEGGGSSGGSGDVPTGAFTPGSGVGNSAAGSSFIQKYLKDQGFSDEQVRGVSAGIAAEGGSLGMAANGAFGIGQWRGDRLAALRARYGNAPTLAQQMEFLVGELRGGDRGGASVMHAGSAFATLNAYINDFMRPGAGAAGDMKRGLAWLGSSGQGAPDVAGRQTELAMALPSGPRLVGSSSIYGSQANAAVPKPIFGAAQLADAGTGAGGASAEARAHLTVTIDDKRKVHTSLDHNAEMEASLDRGASMKLSWG